MTSWLRARLPILLFMPLLLCVAGVRAAPAVLVVSSEMDGAYEQVANAITRELQLSDPAAAVDIVSREAFRARSLDGIRTIVTIGALAAGEVILAAPPMPVLHTLVPRETFARLASSTTRTGDSAIFVDQPADRQIAAIRAALPEWQRLALIAGPQTHELVAHLARIAGAEGFEVVVREIKSDRELFAAMQQIMSRPAVLLAVPDGEIFNSHTIQNILLTSYRQRSPVVGFSPAYVRAGALLALYATPAQIGKQAADAISSVLNGGRLPPPSHSHEYEVGVNLTVARSLGIHPRSAETIKSVLNRREIVE
ncbi:MAG TPA: ABC transporter substrate binding protein [Rhodocyclaceae bacterium]|jgi:putative tryptophan/tyrosine transport system substrate-binding protein|nr:ABC transporter substrate binding protein [Rhodocyclaceae bacterium]HRQ47380.1 ABC transporter substrate binding protein [Rhodocyclaceae bacterium]